MNEAIRASVDALTANTTAAIQGITSQIETTTADIRALKAGLDSVQATLRRPLGTRVANDNRPGEIREELDAVTAFARCGDETKLFEIRATMSVSSDPGGGYFVLPALSDGMTRKLFDQSPMRRLARVVEMTAGSEWSEPIDKDQPDAAWVGEQQARPAGETPDMAMLTIPCLEQYALQPLTQKLLDDASFDIGGWLDGKISDKFARSECTAFISGMGTVDPRGLLTYPTSTATDATRPWGTIQTMASGGSGTVNEVGLKNAVWGIRAPYRQGASWLMNSATASTLDSLKTSGSGEYLWRNSMASGVPDTLLGYPVAICEDMPDLASNSLSVAFGNFKLAYTIVEKPGVRLARDPYTDRPRVLFYAYRRVGGGLANSEAVKLIKTQ